MILLLLACRFPDLGALSARENADCASCHPEHQQDFDRSRHARADASDLFERLRERAAEELGAEGACDACHAPDPGFTCLTCHAAAGNRGTSQGQLVLDVAGPVRGRTRREDAPHATAASDFLVDSALCGTCHDVDAPFGFDEHPYRAWMDSPAAAEGSTCQTCHLPKVSYGRSHRFQGIADGSEAGLELLGSGVAGSWQGERLVLENLTGHHFPDGASAMRELWLSPDVGQEVPLHAELLRDGVRVFDPAEANERLERGLLAGERRGFAFPEAEVVCLTYRSQNLELTLSLGLEDVPLQQVKCFSR